MNSEVIKAMNRKKSKINIIRKWWNKNGYIVNRIILFPIWIGSILKEKIDCWLNSKNGWSDKRAQEILSYYVPRMAEWDAKDKSLYFADNGYGWSMKENRKYLKWKDHRWWNMNRGFWGGDIRKYLIDKFELEGFKKEIGNCYDGWTELTFYLIEK